jgi:hypothetical protein
MRAVAPIDASALAHELELALTEADCAVCRVRRASEREWVKRHAERRRTPSSDADDAEPWSGCCAQHLQDALEAHDVVAGATLALAVVHEAATRLDVQTSTISGLRDKSCRVCAYGAAVELAVLTVLGQALAEREPLAELFARSDGLCLRHVLVAGHSAVAGAEQLRDDARRRLDQLRSQLRWLMGTSPTDLEGGTWLDAYDALRRSPTRIGLPGDGPQRSPA